MSHASLIRRRRFAPFFWTQLLGAFNDNLFKNTLVLLFTFGAFGMEAEGGLPFGWSLATWDIDRGLLLMRDRFGKKPLYYTRAQDGALLFGLFGLLGLRTRSA